MLKKEEKFKFKQDMLCIHKPDLRDMSLTVREDELEIRDGFFVIMPQVYGEVAETAALDFKEYLHISMNISADITDDGADAGNSIVLKLDAGVNADYIIQTDSSILLTAKNERALAQGLYFLEDEMNRRKAPFVKKQTYTHTFMFSPRMTHSGYGFDQYPDEYLSAVAHAGMDAILVFVSGVNKTPSRDMDFNDVTARAAKYGLDVYAYSYIKSEKHPDEPGAQEFYDDAYGAVFRECPGFKGAILVGESIQFPSKDENVSSLDTLGIPPSKPKPGWWPCYDYPAWLDCVKKAIYKYKKDADIVFWTYNWGNAPEEERLRLIRSLPTDISLLVTFETFENVRVGNITEHCADYTLRFEGPGKYFASEAKAAKECGIRLYAMSNTGGRTWDIGTIPYEPMPYQWMKRYANLRAARDNWGLCGLMEAHHYGYYPSFIGELAKKCFISENTDMDSCLNDVLTVHYGGDDFGKVTEALKLWSEAISYYVPSDADQWGAFRVGPAYPFCLIREVKPYDDPTEKAHWGNRIVITMYPADYNPTRHIPTGRGILPLLRLDDEIASLEKMYTCMSRGVEILNSAADKSHELEKLVNMGEYICCCIRTGINAKHWYRMCVKVRASEDAAEIRALCDKMESLLLAEEKNSLRAIEFVQKDSALGWEASMGYLGDADHIRWKIEHLHYVLDFELGIYRKNIIKTVEV